MPRAAILLLNERFTHLTTSVLQCQTSSNADTTKLLLKLQNDMQVEAVIMHYDTTGMHFRGFSAAEITLQQS